jgi:hypothetical protein
MSHGSTLVVRQSRIDMLVTAFRRVCYCGPPDVYGRMVRNSGPYVNPSFPTGRAASGALAPLSDMVRRGRTRVAMPAPWFLLLQCDGTRIEPNWTEWPSVTAVSHNPGRNSL